MEIITSLKNEKIKNIEALLKLKKERDRQGLFVMEGQRIFKDTLETAPEFIHSIFVSESFSKETDPEVYQEKLKSFKSDCKIFVLKDNVFNGISQTVTPQGILCIVRKPEYDLGSILSQSKVKLLLLENIQDPGNLGTMLRTAEAAGMSGIIMSRGCADIFSPKVVRSTMGSVFRMPFIYSEDFYQSLNEIRERDISIYAAYLHGGSDYREVEFGERSAIMIGNEGNGLTEDAVEKADHRVFIPMKGKIESLNAAVAAAILMYHCR